MLSKYAYKNLKWIDLTSPSKEEIIHLIDEYGIPDLVGEEIIQPNVKSRVDSYGNMIYLVLRFPHIDHHREKEPEQEIDFLLGHDFLITAHYEHIHGLHYFSKLFETDKILQKDDHMPHAGFLFYKIMKVLYSYASDELETINGEIKVIEKKLFSKRHIEQALVSEISKTSRKLLDFKQAMRFHEALLNSFEEASSKMFGDDFLYHSRRISAEYKKIQSALDTYREILNDLRITNDSLLSTQTNDTMKRLMMMSFVIFPLSLIAAIFGMNTKYMPVVGRDFDFWMVLGIMAIVTILFFVYFKRKKWL